MNDLIIHSPTVVHQMIILLHGVGSEPQHLLPLGRAIAKQHPNALIVTVGAPFKNQHGMLQWFSVQQVTEQNRPERVAAALPSFFQQLRPWLQRARTLDLAPILFGFSQGGIMLLEAAKTTELADCKILVCASRFADLPNAPLNIHQLGWIHGRQDPLFPSSQAINSAQHLEKLGQHVQLYVNENMGHEIPVMDVLEWVTNKI